MRRILYEEVAQDMKEKILQGVYPVGSYIPTENELEASYDVSKVTVRRAIEILSNEGYLEKKSGKGTRVLSNRTFNKLSKANSFSSILEESGHDISKRVLSVKQVDVKDVAVPIALTNTSKITQYTRMYDFDKKPYIYFEHYISTHSDPKELEESDVSLYSWLHRHGIRIDQIADTFDCVEVPFHVKEVLNFPGNHILRRIRSSFDNEGNCVEYAISYYNTEIYPYEVHYDV